MFFEMNVYSKSLRMQTQVNIILPDEKVKRPYKTLWLLHGLSDNHTSWMRNTSIERYAKEYGLAVVMPSVQRTWYTDTAYDANYFTFVTKELPEICRTYFNGMSPLREDNIVAGLSMGGYGALKSALTCPEQYGYCISLSGALDITRKGRKLYTNEWQSIFGFDLKNEEELAGSEHDLFALAEKARQNGTPLPTLYLWCGTEDHLIEINRKFHSELERLHIAHCYEESEGDHSWKYWDKHIQSGLKYILK